MAVARSWSDWAAANDGLDFVAWLLLSCRLKLQVARVLSQVMLPIGSSALEQVTV